MDKARSRSLAGSRHSTLLSGENLQYLPQRLIRRRPGEALYNSEAGQAGTLRLEDRSKSLDPGVRRGDESVALEFAGKMAMPDDRKRLSTAGHNFPGQQSGAARRLYAGVAHNLFQVIP